MKQIGKRSLDFQNQAPFILASGNVVGSKESEGPMGALFDMIGEDDHFGGRTWEEAESIMQKNALAMTLTKAGMDASQVRYLFSGDLLGQSMASSFGLKDYEIPMFGVYGACSTCGESLSLAAMSVAAGMADISAAVTSSHFGSAEKQFRFPNQYANQRPVSATWTVTGSAGFILGNKQENKDKSRVIISGITTGIIVDYGVKDSMNMGAAMAPAAADLIVNHLRDFEREPSYYDAIVTGDLGKVGQEILFELCQGYKIDISPNHCDCGMLIYDLENQDVGSGGSGCGCSATVFSAYFLPELMEGGMKRILFIPTGALLSPVSFNEGQTVPGIAHGLVIERI